MSTLLEVEDLHVGLRRGRTAADLLDGVSFSLERSETLGVVGESGCGKSLLALAIMGLLPAGMTARGQIRLRGVELLSLDDRMMRKLRGRQIGIVFQEPMLALNPLQSVGHQVAEGMRLQLGLGRGEAEVRTRALLDRVGLPAARVPPETLPHRLSGGQRQRVLIAIALACEPALLLADEFSTALDMATQAQIVALLADITAERHMAMMLVSHDLGLVRDVAARVLVLYAGRVAELGDTDAVFARTAHPYTERLLAATLHGTWRPPGTMLPTVAGQVPDAFTRASACAFAQRCDRADMACRIDAPPFDGPSGHLAACFHPVARA